MKKRSLVKVAVFGLVLVACIVLMSIGKKGKAVFEARLDFTLLDMQGRSINLAQFSHNKVVILNFWVSWDHHWQDEAVVLQKLYNQYRKRGFEVISVSLDDGGHGDVKPILDQLKVNYTVLMGNEAISGYYHPWWLPTTYIIDRKGKLRKQYEGAQSQEVLAKDIESLLN